MARIDGQTYYKYAVNDRNGIMFLNSRRPTEEQIPSFSRFAFANVE